MEFPLLEKHPWLTGGAILGGALALFLYWRSGSSSSSAGVPGVIYAGSGTDPATIAANAQMQMAQLSAGVANANIAATQTANDNKLSAQLAVAMGTLQLQNNQSIQDAATNQAFIQAQTEASLSHDSTVAQVARYQMDTSVNVQAMNNQTALGLATVNDATAIHLATIGAASDAYSTDANVKAHLADLNTAEHLASINGKTAVDVTSLTTSAKTAQTAIEAEAAKNINYYQGVTALGINAQNTDAAKAIAVTQAERDKAITNATVGGAVAITNAQTGAAVAIANATTGAAVTIANSQAGTATAISNANNSTLQKLIDAMSTDASQKNAIISNVVSGVNSGVFNKGGAGGANQVSIISALFGTPSIGVSAQAGVTSAAQSNSPASILTGIASVLKGAGTAAFGG
jgi:hypothetical protein